MVAAEGMSGGAGGRESGGAVTWYEEVVWRGRPEEEEEEEGGSVASEHGRERWLAGWRLAGEREAVEVCWEDWWTGGWWCSA